MRVPGNLKSWLRDQKDNSLSFVLEKVMRKQIEPFGQLLEFKLDTRSGTAVVKVLLKGETDPVTVWVDEYQLITSPGNVSVVMVRARASREWLTILLQEFLIGKPFEIPEKYAGYAKMLL